MNVNRHDPTPAKTAIANVRVFDGRALSGPATVVVVGDRIGTDETGARVVDGAGCALLPGLIDAHVHLHGVENLEQARSFGVTTMLDMAAYPPALIDSLRGLPGLPDIRSPLAPASAPGGTQSTRMGFPPESTLTGPDGAERFVADRAAEGADYVKIIVEDPAQMGAAALGQDTIDALVAAARARGMLTVAHAARLRAMRMAFDSGVDVITHAPIDRPAGTDLAEGMASAGTISVPTLVMELAVTDLAIASSGGKATVDYGHARSTVAAQHRAGVPILAGTDANAAPGSPVPVAHGEALHHELELLVDAGLSATDALRAATSLPARHFRLTDRGGIGPGLRADLVLVDGNPLEDIRATRNIRRVWCKGTEHVPG